MGTSKIDNITINQRQRLTCCHKLKLLPKKTSICLSPCKPKYLDLDDPAKREAQLQLLKEAKFLHNDVIVLLEGQYCQTIKRIIEIIGIKRYLKLQVFVIELDIYTYHKQAILIKSQKWTNVTHIQGNFHEYVLTLNNISVGYLDFMTSNVDTLLSSLQHCLKSAAKFGVFGLTFTVRFFKETLDNRVCKVQELLSNISRNCSLLVTWPYQRKHQPLMTLLVIKADVQVHTSYLATSIKNVDVKTRLIQIKWFGYPQPTWESIDLLNSIAWNALAITKTNRRLISKLLDVPT